MGDMMWRMAATLVVLTGLLVGGNASCSSAGLGADQAGSVAPQAQISAFLAAIAEGDRVQAESFWSIDGASPVLIARRETVVDELLSYGLRLEYHLLSVEWWRTDGQPGPVGDAAQAGAARLQVAVSSEARTLQIYHFDLLGPGGQRQGWELIDIYPDSSSALAWPWR